MAIFDATRSESETLRDAKITGDKSDHPLDSEEWQNRLQELMRFRRQSRAAHSENRREMAVDEDYYDNIQYTEDQIAILEGRDQSPRTWNIVKNICNWIIGTERKMRVDYRVLPRKKEHSESAKAKTKAMKFVSDDSRAEYCLSAAFTDSIKAGVGWIEEAIRDDESKEPLYVRAEDWRNVWFDHLGRSTDCSDWRYIIREKWLDLDVAQAMFSDRKEELEQIAQGVNSLYPYNPEDTILNDPATEFDMENDFDALTGGAYDGYRLRVKIVEMWYRFPAKSKILRVSADIPIPYGSVDGVMYREKDPVHEYLVRNKYATTTDSMRMQIRCAMWCGATYLQDEPSPFNHDRFPLVPIFCYRRKRDGMPYGIIRDIRSPQDAINAHKSRIEFLLAADKVILEKGAVDKPSEFYDEYTRPDCVAIVNTGTIGKNKIKIVEGHTQIQGHVEEVQDSQRFVQSISGVQDPLRGQTKQELSGKAIGLLQNQGMTTSGIPFDNYYEAFQLAGEIRLSNIEQFYDTEKTLRITGSQNKEEFVEINKFDPETGRVLNSITESKADFVVSKQDYRETVRQAMMISFGETMTALAQTGGKAGEVVFALLDIWVDMMDDLPMKDEAVARIRKLNGQEGPDEEITPEERQVREQRKQVMQAEAAKAQAFQEELMQLEKRIKEAEAASKEADAQGKQTKALFNSIEASVKRIEGFTKAMEAAGMVSLAPELVAGADALIEESDVIGDEHLPPITRQMAPQPQQMQPIGEQANEQDNSIPQQ